MAESSQILQSKLQVGSQLWMRPLYTGKYWGGVRPTVVLGIYYPYYTSTNVQYYLQKLVLVMECGTHPSILLPVYCTPKMQAFMLVHHCALCALCLCPAPVPCAYALCPAYGRSLPELHDTVTAGPTHILTPSTESN